MNKLTFAAALAGVMTLGTVAACNSDAGGGAGATVRVGVYPGTFLSIVPWVADAQGFFKNNGLSVEISSVATGPQMTAQLASKQIDFATNSIDNLALARKQGLKPVVVAGNGNSFPFVVIVRDGVPIGSGPYPEVMRSLKGRKVGVLARGGSTELLVRNMLTDAGMNPDKDVVWIAAGGPSQALPALKDGSVDAYLAYDPTQTLTEANGFAKPLVDMTKGQGPADFQHVDYNALWALDSYLGAHEDTVRRLVKAELQATCWIHDPANLDALVGLVSDKISSSGLTPAQYKAMIQRDAAVVGATFQKSSLEHWNAFLTRYKLITDPLSAADALWSQLPETNPYC